MAIHHDRDSHCAVKRLVLLSGGPLNVMATLHLCEQ
jgi:hypothetical protein